MPNQQCKKHADDYNCDDNGRTEVEHTTRFDSYTVITKTLKGFTRTITDVEVRTITDVYYFLTFYY